MNFMSEEAVTAAPAPAASRPRSTDSDGSARWSADDGPSAPAAAGDSGSDGREAALAAACGEAGDLLEAGLGESPERSGEVWSGDRTAVHGGDGLLGLAGGDTTPRKSIRRDGKSGDSAAAESIGGLDAGGLWRPRSLLVPGSKRAGPAREPVTALTFKTASTCSSRPSTCCGDPRRVRAESRRAASGRSEYRWRVPATRGVALSHRCRCTPPGEACVPGHTGRRDRREREADDSRQYRGG